MDVLGQLSNLKHLAESQTSDVPNNHKVTLYVQNQRRLKPGQISGLIDDYKKGAGTTQLAHDYSIHRTTVWNHLKRAGIPRRPATRKLTHTQVHLAAERYALGFSVAAIAAEFEVNAETLRREFIKADIPRR